MSFVYEPLKMVMLFIKIPNALFSLALAFKIKSLSKYVLNYLFYIAFVCWSVYISLDGLLFIIAPNSASTLVLANMMRDLVVFMLAFIPLCFIQASFIIKEGEEIALNVKKTRVVSTFIVSFAIAIVMALTDTIIVVTNTKPPVVIDPQMLPPTGSFTVKFDNITPLGVLSSYFILAFVAWYICSVLLMTVQQARESGRKRTRSRFIMFGFLMIPVGICYFILTAYLVIGSDLRTWVNLGGQLIWAMSPVLVYLGMRLKIPSLEQEIAEKATSEKR